jgi:type IV pilus assembly protein PilM
MSLLSSISQFVKDPPPSHAFEFSEDGIAFARRVENGAMETGFMPFDPGTLMASPVADNLLRTDVVSSALARIAPANGTSKRRHAALILPDYAARVSVLDFDSFPSSPAEQLSLIKFRLKKTLPYDIESASVSYHVQAKPAHGKIDVVAVTVAMEILARYEAVFRAQNFHAGDITIAGLASLNLVHDEDVVIVAKLVGRALTLMVATSGILKLFRCVELEGTGEDEVLQVLHPTIAYVEDELRAKTGKLILTGFEGAGGDFQFEKQALRSRLGPLGPSNAGLLGYLEGAES